METSDDRNKLFIIISLKIGTVAVPGVNSAQRLSQRVNGPERVKNQFLCQNCGYSIVTACVKVRNVKVVFTLTSSQAINLAQYQIICPCWSVVPLGRPFHRIRHSDCNLSPLETDIYKGLISNHPLMKKGLQIQLQIY